MKTGPETSTFHPPVTSARSINTSHPLSRTLPGICFNAGLSNVYKCHLAHLLNNLPNITYQEVYAEVGVTRILGKDWDILDYKELINNPKPITGISEMKRIELKM
ncbi:hypothetical protein C0J52_12875 [Blattella germanica]|nr:hypothetical protein C0J52_12875 [Blattella germanica]